MLEKLNTTTTVEVKSAWQCPAINYIDIKRTMSIPGGSLSDSQFNSPGTSKTSLV